MSDRKSIYIYEHDNDNPLNSKVIFEYHGADNKKVEIAKKALAPTLTESKKNGKHLSVVSENFKPSIMFSVGRRLIELQNYWHKEDGGKYPAWDVFCDGRGLGRIIQKNETFYIKNNHFDDINQAIANLIKNKARPASVTWINDQLSGLFR